MSAGRNPHLQSLTLQGLITFTAVEVDMAGIVHPQAIEAALTDATCLISIMHSNNEVGSIQPTQQIAQLARQHDVLMHSDAAQSIGKVLDTLTFQDTKSDSQ